MKRKAAFLMCQMFILSQAALHGNKEIVSYLVCMKVNIAAENMLAETPADLARRMDHRGVLELLT
jgi:ankyrin repeat protein